MQNKIKIRNADVKNRNPDNFVFNSEKIQNEAEKRTEKSKNAL